MLLPSELQKTHRALFCFVLFLFEGFCLFKLQIKHCGSIPWKLHGLSFGVYLVILSKISPALLQQCSHTLASHGCDVEPSPLL